MWIIKKSKAHLRGSQIDYLHHFWHAFSLGWILIFNGISSIIHAFIPAFFPGTAAFTTMRIFYKVCYNHPNPYFQHVRNTYKQRYAKEDIFTRVHKINESDTDKV